MIERIELARVSGDGYVLEFPKTFRQFGIVVGLAGLALWGLLYVEWRQVGELGAMRIDSFLLVKVFTLPFGVGLLLWSTQKISVVQNLITSHHLGGARELDRSTSRIRAVRKSGMTIQDGSGKKLFVSDWMLESGRLADELGQRQDNDAGS